jgi:hypothetical protein
VAARAGGGLTPDRAQAVGHVDASVDPLLVEGLVRFSAVPARGPVPARPTPASMSAAPLRTSTDELRKLAKESVSLARKKAPPSVLLLSVAHVGLALADAETTVACNLNDVEIRARVREAAEWCVWWS